MHFTTIVINGFLHKPILRDAKTGEAILLIRSRGVDQNGSPRDLLFSAASGADTKQTEIGLKYGLQGSPILISGRFVPRTISISTANGPREIIENWIQVQIILFPGHANDIRADEIEARAEARELQAISQAGS